MADLLSEIVDSKALEQLRELNADLEKSVSLIDAANKASKGLIIEFKGSQNINDINEALKKQQKHIEKLKQTQEDYSQKVFTAEEKRARAIEMANARAEKAERARIDAAVKAAEREAKATAKLTNEYEQLKVKYRDAANEAKRLGVALGTNSKEFKAAAASSMQMYTELLRVEKAVGQAQRQVGQYNQAAFAMQQVLRETPSIAYGFTTWIMAISNNLPILTDEINKLRKANADLVATGGKAIPVWKTLTQGLFSLSGVATIAVSAIAILASQTDLFKAKADAAAESAKDFKEALDGVAQSAGESYFAQQTAVQSFIDILKDENASQQIRIKALEELTKKYPQYLQGLSLEEALRSKAIKDLQEEIGWRVQVEAIQSRLGVLYKEQTALIQKLNFEQSEMYEDEIYAANQRLNSIQTQIDNSKKELADAQKALLTFPQNEQQKKDDKDVSEKIIKTETELLNARYDLNKQRLQNDAETQQAIIDNDKSTTVQRLGAQMNFEADSLELARLNLDHTKDLEKIKLEDITRLKKVAKGQELANLEDQEKAAYVRMMAAEEQFEAELSKIAADGEQDRIDILKRGTESWIKASSQSFEERKAQEAAQYIVEENLLNNAYHNKEMSRREYNKRLAELQKKQHIAFLQAEIEFDNRILSNDNLTNEQRLQYQKKLANDIEALAKAQKGIRSTRATGRITDPFARLVAPADLENEEQYLQEFYNRTIDLANAATDAIINARNRQFQVAMQQIDAEKEANRDKYEQEARLINATTQNDIERQNKLAELAAQTTARENAIEAKRRQIAIEQAKFQRTASMAAIIQNTAVAIAGALKYGAAAPAIIALIAASGAIQLSAAANAPIPAYKEGTGAHPGGLFFAGDGGERELIVAPGKRPYWSSNVTTLYNEGAGTSVIPESKIPMFTPPSMSTRYQEIRDRNQMEAMTSAFGSIIAKEFDKTGRKLAVELHNTRANDIDMRPIADQMRRERNLQGK